MKKAKQTARGKKFASLEDVRTTYLPHAPAGLAHNTLENPKRTGSVLASHLMRDLVAHVKRSRKTS